MFKFVVLCAFLAAATATPGFIAPLSPLSYSANIVAPAPAVYASHPSSVVYSSPIVSSAPLAYSSPYGYAHLIKKRSAPLAISSYIAPSSYVASAPLISTYAGPLTSYATPFTTTYAGPLATTYSSPLYTTAHLIKKRSAPLIVPSTYVAPAHYASPFYTSTYTAASPIVSTPYISSSPIAYSTHFIKKRSAPLAVAAYAAPSFSHQTRFDYRVSSPAVTTYSSYASPLVYPSSVGVSHLI